jgi:hypothetical protein
MPQGALESPRLRDHCIEEVFGVPLKPIKPANLAAFEKAQAKRVRTFLQLLAKDDKLLVAYIDDRVTVLQAQVKAKKLTHEDVALLLDSDYTRIYEVMSKGSAPQRWIVVWIV